MSTKAGKFECDRALKAQNKREKGAETSAAALIKPTFPVARSIRLETQGRVLKEERRGLSLIKA